MLKGKALDTYSRLSPEDALDYDKVVLALRKRYQLTDEGFRVKFRTTRPERGENPLQYAARLSGYLDRWIEMSNTGKTYESMVDLMLREQFLISCSKELEVFLKERTCSSIDHMAQLAETYTEAHGISSFTGTSGHRTNNGRSFNKYNGKQKQTDVTKPRVDSGSKSSSVTGQQRFSNVRCHTCHGYGHMSYECGNKKPRVAKERTLGNVSGSAQTQEKPDKAEVQSSDKTRCCCSHTCPNTSNASSAIHKICKSKSKMFSCEPKQELQSNIVLPERPVTKGYVSGCPVNVLRDTGCDTAVISRKLVRPEQMTGKVQQTKLMDGSVHSYQTARLHLDCPYFTGEIEAMVMDKPVYECVVGNIPGAKDAFNPDPNWKPHREKTDAKYDGSSVTGAVETRAMAEKKAKPTKPLRTADPIPEISHSEFIKAQHDDKSIAHLWVKANDKTESGNGKYKFIVKNELLYRTQNVANSVKGEPQLVVPNEMRKRVMSIAHDSIMSGHQGAGKTTDRILAQFYWPGLFEDVRHYCRSCDVCQRTIPKGKVGKVPLGKMPIIDTPFQRVAVDIVGPITPATDRGKRYILTVVDYASRYPDAVALANIDTETVAEALLDIYSRVGIPQEVLSDRGTQFTSDVMKEVSRLLSLKQLTSTPYHPICNGLVERFNGTLKLMLKRMCVERPKDWDRYLISLLFAYRETPQESTGFAPFEVLYGRNVRGPLAILKELWTKEKNNPDIQNSYQYVIDLKDKLSTTCEVVKQELEKSAKRYKHYYDSKKRPRNLEVGEKVLILLPTESNKLLMQWKGPYSVVGKFNNCDYKIDVDGKTKSFHINLLKQYVSRDPLPQTMGIFDVILPPEECETESIDQDFLIVDKTADSVSSASTSTASRDAETYDEGDFADFDIVPVPRAQQNEFTDDVKINVDLGTDEKKELQSLLAEFSDVFTDLPLRTSAIECKINLTTEDAIKSKPYPIPFASREILRKEVSNMLSLGIVEPCISPYASPVVMVPKKDSTTRVCIDYRKLNRVTIFDPEPMPNPEELFSELSKSKFFSKLDLTKGYYQIPVAECDKDKTAFVTWESQYRFLTMPFGLQNAGAIFTRLMKKLFGNEKHVVNYIDDILIHTETWCEHVYVIQKVLNILKDANLAAKPSKCFLGFLNLEFLGHKVGNGTLATNPDLLKKIQGQDRPTTKKQIRSFLGTTGFYRKFVPNYAHIALPLTELTKKGQPDKINWGEAQENAYCTLKTLLSKPPILRLPDFDRPFILRCDASSVGLGSLLLQEFDDGLHPLAYASKKLLPRECNYSTIERECLAIVWGIKKFHLYLSGRSFILQTDHMPLTFIQKAKLTNKRIMGWAMTLQEYRFRVMSIPGKDNFGSDFLSRVPGD